MMTRTCLIIMPVLFAASSLQGQPNKFDLSNLARTGGLTVQNRSITALAEGERKGIRFSAHEEDGVAWLNAITFSDGIIEVDIRGKDLVQQSFVGIAFHAENKDSLEAVYFRPFNFRYPDSLRKSHAVQYVFLPDFPWERLRNEHPGKYEDRVDPAPDPDQWFHAKIVVHYPEISVYVNNAAAPCLVVHELSVRKEGRIGLWVGNNSAGDFANLIITNQ